MEKITFIIFIISLLLSFCNSASADLDTLIEVGHGQVEIAKHYRTETKNYEAIKRAIDNGRLNKGEAKAKIEKEYGEPVVTFWDSGKKKEKWIYKPARASFFTGEQICLFFDNNGILDEIKTRKAETPAK